MERQEAETKMKGLYAKAAAARKEGKRDQAKSFAAGAKRLQRKIRLMPKPVEAPAAAEEATEEAAPEEAASEE